MRRIVLCLLVFSPVLLNAQKLKRADKLLTQNLENHIKFLASDELEGRRAGTLGEQKAVDYIIAQYQNAGIKPMAANGYIQSFPIDEGKKLSASSFIKVNKQTLLLDSAFFPISNSGTGNIKSMASLSLNEAKQIWFKDVGEVLEENTSNPHFDINEWLLTTAKQTKQKGGAALFLYNSGSLVDNIQYYKFDTAKALAIPVVYITKKGFSKYFSDELSTYDIEASIEFEHPSRTAHNVVAFIDNKAATTVILGAHLDHLGYNEDHNALDINNNIRNGADDNASGTAALIELAKALQKKSPKNNNYLILHFSGEELGLFGSKYWLDHPTYTGNFNYMINMDMVGRYDTARKLTVGGFGTSSKWANILASVPTSLITHYDSAGSGPSDHASFYRKDMPVLFMFTGSHSDYHKATDDWDKINYVGESQIIRYVQSIIKATDAEGKLDFLKTREAAMGRSTKFTVSLGVMPDYAFTGTGVRIEGTSQGKLAEKIGLKGGDVLLQLGDYKLVDVMSYMQALSKFKKGDASVLVYKRGTEEIKVEIIF
ncbi:MAG: M28 family peptidase [Chitinophagia bacterium]|nr:M28 family peptidase [Chitinophagia bacterium]NCA29244.1 M28 family peptidase [Chitinophagia bacterium]NDD16340.1 M28 family peptidase [Chitinophagia bacterium]